MSERWRAAPGYALPVFAVADLAAEWGPVVVLDGELRIVALGGGWTEAWLAHGVEGDPYAWLTRDIREAMQPEPRVSVERLMRIDRACTETYDCAIGGAPRLFRMICYPLDGRGLVCVHSGVVAPELRRGALITACASCRRWRAPDDRRRWAHGDPAREGARISHGLCPPCRDFEFR